MFTLVKVTCDVRLVIERTEGFIQDQNSSYLEKEGGSIVYPP